MHSTFVWSRSQTELLYLNLAGRIVCKCACIRLALSMAKLPDLPGELTSPVGVVCSTQYSVALICCGPVVESKVQPSYFAKFIIIAYPHTYIAWY